MRLRYRATAGGRRPQQYARQRARETKVTRLPGHVRSRLQRGMVYNIYFRDLNIYKLYIYTYGGWNRTEDDDDVMIINSALGTRIYAAGTRCVRQNKTYATRCARDLAGGDQGCAIPSPASS